MANVTIKDIAKMCNVGVSTVSRTLNGHPDVNPETRKQILEAVEKMHYVPNNSARNLGRSENDAIALLVKGVSNTLFSPMIGIIEEEAKERGYDTVLHSVGFYEDELDVARELVKEKRLRGIIFLGGFSFHSEEKLNELDVPFVLATTGYVTERFNRGTYSSVSVDDEAEARKMTEYLIKMGHHRIAILGPSLKDNSSVGGLRLLGYKSALVSNGFDYNEKLIIPMDRDTVDYSMENGYAAMTRFLKEGGKCSAVFAISDTLAIGAERAIHDLGMRTPADIAVAGFDGIEAGRFMIPSITTIRQPVEDMAESAADILFNVIEKTGDHRHETFLGELIERESTKLR